MEKVSEKDNFLHLTQDEIGKWNVSKTFNELGQ